MAFRPIAVVRCAACGFLYAGAVLRPERLRAYYAEGFAGDRQRRGQMVNARVNALAVRRLVDLSRVRSALDVGCGYGDFLRRLADRHGIRGRGLELSRQEADFARATLGLDVLAVPIEEAGLPEGAFDLVTSFEVIEHVPDPMPFLGQLARLLVPGGTLVVMTDNFESAVCRALGPGFPKWIPHTHVSHFSAATLRWAVEHTPGLRLERLLSFTPWELVARRVLARGRVPTAEAAFDLERTLAAEMAGRYRLFRLRLALCRAWFGLTAGPREDGALVYAVARRAP